MKLPFGVFKPYAGVSTAILFFRRADSGGTGNVWFYDVCADGYSLDDMRNPTDVDDLPDVLARWKNLDAEAIRPRTAQSFLAAKQEIADQGYDLSINRCKELELEEVEHRSPLEILANLERINGEIVTGAAELKEALQ